MLTEAVRRWLRPLRRQEGSLSLYWQAIVVIFVMFAYFFLSASQILNTYVRIKQSSDYSLKAAVKAVGVVDEDGKYHLNNEALLIKYTEILADNLGWDHDGSALIPRSGSFIHSVTMAPLEIENPNPLPAGQFPTVKAHMDVVVELIFGGVAHRTITGGFDTTVEVVLTHS